MRDVIGALAEALYDALTGGWGLPPWEKIEDARRAPWRDRAEKLIDMRLGPFDKWLGIGEVHAVTPPGPQPTAAPEQTEGVARDRVNLFLVETETWRIRPSTLEEDGVQAEGARLTTIENVTEDESLRGLDSGDLRELARALHCYRLLRGM